MSRPMTEEEIANLSDDELMNMAIPPVAMSEPPEEEQEPPAEEQAEPEAAEASGGEAPEAEDAEEEEEQTEEEPSDSSETLATSDDKFSESQEKAPEKKEEPKAEEDPPEEKSEEKSEAKAEDKGIDYKAAYERIMGPFKANGKEIQLQSIDEAIQLMQMGANYTKKLQALQPNLKLLKMLENNGLLDEGKLSYLIDIDKKNPEAIQKLIRESGLDPLEIDTSVEPAYKSGNYRVSDEEMMFTSTLEEVASDPVGKEMIVHINKTWDPQSKEALWSDPAILRVVTEHKQNGLYDQISSEVERRRILGHLRNEPFIQAYYSIGQEMQQKGLLVPRQQANAPTIQSQPASRVVDTRPAQKKTVTNSDKARAASPTKAAPKKVVQDFNPLAMPDEEFEKHAELARRL